MNLAEWMQKYRSNVGNILLVVVLILATPDAVSITIGFFVLLSGALFRAWCAGYISDDDFPRVGPYSLSRNPMAFGNLLIGIGVAVGGICVAVGGTGVGVGRGESTDDWNRLFADVGNTEPGSKAITIMLRRNSPATGRRVVQS